jgi:hypothetical protein
MRAVNRLLGLLLGLALVAGGPLAAVDGALALLDRPPWPIRFDRWLGRLTDTALRDPGVVAVAVGVGAVGLVLLFLQLRPWAPRRLAIDDGWWVQRRSVEQHLAGALDSVNGVHGGRARLRGRGSRWRLKVSAQGRPPSRTAVRDAVRAELATLRAPDGVPLRVSLREPRGRV